MKKTTSRYTYESFANEIKEIVNFNLTITPEIAKRVTEKADALLAAQASKKLYNETNPKKSAKKGASDETKEKASEIEKVLSETPLTAVEINTLIGKDYSALQVANAIKYISGATSTKVVRDMVNNKGLKQEKEYTAYLKV